MQLINLYFPDGDAVFGRNQLSRLTNFSDSLPLLSSFDPRDSMETFLKLFKFHQKEPQGFEIFSTEIPAILHLIGKYNMLGLKRVISNDPREQLHDSNVFDIEGGKLLLIYLRSFFTFPPTYTLHPPIIINFSPIHSQLHLSGAKRIKLEC